MWTDSDVHAYLTAPRPLAASAEDVATWPRCPKCKGPIEEQDHNFCQFCGHDLQPLQHRCAACGVGYHVALRSGAPSPRCGHCGVIMPAWPATAALM